VESPCTLCVPWMAALIVRFRVGQLLAPESLATQDPDAQFSWPVATIICLSHMYYMSNITIGMKTVFKIRNRKDDTSSVTNFTRGVLCKRFLCDRQK